MVLKKDYNKANEYFKKSCDLNYGSGCINLGDNYLNGDGLEKDINKASEYYQKACDLGYGCYFIVTYINGVGYKMEIEEYEEKCNSGNSATCVDLGWIYINGNGGIKKT